MLVTTYPALFLRGILLIFSPCIFSLYHSSLEGKPLESIGTGFDRTDMHKIAQRHTLNPGGVTIAIVCQGFIETGQIWHGRLSEAFE